MATKSLADEVEALCQTHHATILHKKPQLGCRVCDGIADLALRVGEAVQAERERCVGQIRRLAAYCERIGTSASGWKLLADKLEQGEIPATVHTAPTTECPSGCGKSRDWLHCDDVWHLSKPPPEPAND